MPTIPQRVASAFAVLCGQYGDVTQMARDRERSRQSLYREAEQVADAVDGAAAQARIDELQQQLAQRQAEVQALQDRLKRAVEITPDKQDEFAAVAQAEGAGQTHLICKSLAVKDLGIVLPRTLNCNFLSYNNLRT